MLAFKNDIQFWRQNESMKASPEIRQRFQLCGTGTGTMSEIGAFGMVIFFLTKGMPLNLLQSPASTALVSQKG